MMAQVLTFASSQASIWIAGISCSHDQLALFGAAGRLAMVVTLPLDMIGLAVISTISELHAQGRLAELQRVLQLTAGAAAIVALLAFTAMLILPATILDVTFGPFYRNAATVLLILGAGQLVSSMTGSCGYTLTMTGHHNWNLSVNLVATVLLIAIGPLAAAHFGIAALALVSATILAFKNVVLLLLVRKLIGVWTHARPAQAATLLWRKAMGWSPRQPTASG
jgi:O-antigen/teichoic acid export membrane protein